MAAKITAQTRLAVLQDIMAGQMTRLEMAQSNHTSLATIDRCRSIYKNRPKGIPLAELAGKKPYGTGKSEKITSKADKLTQTIHSMHESGLPIRKIAEQLKVSKGTVNYHMYIRNAKRDRTHEYPKNGGSSGINKNVSLGIAYAETERFIAHLGERLALPSAFLRSRLSELLGRAEIRGARRDED